MTCIGAHVTTGRVRRGVTLLELMVVLVLLALLAGVAGLSLRTARPAPAVTPSVAWLRTLQDSAVRSGHAITGTFPVADAVRASSHHVAFATAYPDGRVVADSGLEVNPLNGMSRTGRAAVLPPASSR